LFMCLRCAHHSVWGQIVFTFIYYNSFPTSPLSVTKESSAVEKCARQPWSWRQAPHISLVTSLLVHLIVDVKKSVCHFFCPFAPFVHEAPGPSRCSNHIIFRARMSSVQVMTKMLQQSQIQWCRTKIGFRPHTHRMIWGSIKGSNKLLLLGISMYAAMKCVYILFQIINFP